MAENSGGVVVTEGMLTEAAGAGNLERLTLWARQGVRVTSGKPLYVATRAGHLEVLRWLVQELGADVSQIYNGDTPLIVAADINNLATLKCLVELGADVNQDSGTDTPLMVAALMSMTAVVRCLIELGAEVGAVDTNGDTALFVCARYGSYAKMHYLLEEAGASMDDLNNDGKTVWGIMTQQLEFIEEKELYLDEDEKAALTGLLRVMVLRAAPPPALVALLSPEPARVVQKGARLRGRLPAYLAHRRAYLDSRCPRISLLPGVLRALIHGFEGPATTEERWATRLGTAD
jgi:hypothetical protein